MASEITLGLPSLVPDKEIEGRHDVYGEEFICHLRKTSSVLYGMFVEIVRQQYMQPDGRLKGVPDVVWNQDGGRTGIWIDTELRWEDERPEFRPAIYVKLGQTEFRKMDGVFSGGGVSLENGVYSYATSGTGSVSFVHVARTPGEACILCDNTETYLDAFSDIIRRDYCFTEFSLASRVPLQQSQKESKETYASTTTFRYGFSQTNSIKLESPILKTFGINIGQKPRYAGIISGEVRRPSL